MILLHVCPGTKPAIKILSLVTVLMIEETKIRMPALFKDLVFLRHKDFGMRILPSIQNEKASCKQDQKNMHESPRHGCAKQAQAAERKKINALNNR